MQLYFSLTVRCLALDHGQPFLLCLSRLSDVAVSHWHRHSAVPYYQRMTASEESSLLSKLPLDTRLNIYELMLDKRASNSEIASSVAAS
jgi:hypothetical protein